MKVLHVLQMLMKLLKNLTDTIRISRTHNDLGMVYGQKAEDVFEIKQKELTSSALQIIENGEIMLKFKNELKTLKNKLGKEHQTKINRLSKSISINSNKNW